MKRNWTGFILALSLGLGVNSYCAQIDAANPVPDPDATGWENTNRLANRLGLFGNFGVTTYAMGDENRYIDAISSPVVNQDGVAIKDLDGGTAWNLGAEFGITDHILIGLEYEALSARTSGALTSGESAEIEIPAAELGGFLKIVWPVGTHWLTNFGFGLYSLRVADGKEKYAHADGTFTSDTYQGVSYATKLWIGAEYFITRTFALGLDGGYRSAKIGAVTNQSNQKWVNPDGTNFVLDFSGFFAQTGVRVYF